MPEPDELFGDGELCAMAAAGTRPAIRTADISFIATPLPVWRQGGNGSCCGAVPRSPSRNCCRNGANRSHQIKTRELAVMPCLSATTILDKIAAPPAVPNL